MKIIWEHCRAKRNLSDIQFCFTSFGTDFGGLTKIQGQCYHLIRSFLPLPKESYKVEQIYFIGDNQAEAQQRCQLVHIRLELDIVMELLEMFQ